MIILIKNTSFIHNIKFASVILNKENNHSSYLKGRKTVQLNIEATWKDPQKQLFTLKIIEKYIYYLLNKNHLIDLSD